MNYSTGERNEDMTSTTHAAAVSHLVSEIIGSLRTRANGWSSEACETCEDMDVEKPAR
jgi:hypothetical protein